MICQLVSFADITAQTSIKLSSLLAARQLLANISQIASLQALGGCLSVRALDKWGEGGGLTVVLTEDYLYLYQVFCRSQISH